MARPLGIVTAGFTMARSASPPLRDMAVKFAIVGVAFEIVKVADT
jgi:hypothetical protein